MTQEKDAATEALPNPATLPGAANAVPPTAGTPAKVQAVDMLDLDATPQGFNAQFPAEVPWNGTRITLMLTTEGWEAAGDEYRTNNPRPQPPYTWEILEDPAMLARLGFSKPEAVKAYDPGDPVFVEALGDWMGGYNRYVVAACMVTPIKFEGKVLTDTKERAAALLLRGMGNGMAASLSQMIVEKHKARKTALTVFSGGA